MTTETTLVTWITPIPWKGRSIVEVPVTYCDGCGATDKPVIDTPTVYGPWAHLCWPCWRAEGLKVDGKASSMATILNPIVEAKTRIR